MGSPGRSRKSPDFRLMVVCFFTTWMVVVVSGLTLLRRGIDSCCGGYGECRVAGLVGRPLAVRIDPPDLCDLSLPLRCVRSSLLREPWSLLRSPATIGCYAAACFGTSELQLRRARVPQVQKL